MESRDPDVVIGGDYLFRWWVVRSRWLSVYVHVIARDDDPRALHDHRSWTLSWILGGGYLEHTRHCVQLRSEGDVILRSPRLLHRLALPQGGQATTLFITGPHVREWGFATESGWKRHDEYLATFGASTGPEAQS